MMRPSTVLWIALAGGVGVGVYQLKHRVQALEDELFRLNRHIVQEQDAIHVLRAEWAYINQPQRLEALAQRHLAMQAMTPAQMGGVADLPSRPPPVEPQPPAVAALPVPTPPVASALAPPPAPAPTGARQAARASDTRSETEGRATAEGRSGAPAARAPLPAPAPSSRPAAPAPRAEPSIADLLAAMRPPPVAGTGDPYARGGPAGAARMPVSRGASAPTGLGVLTVGGSR